MRETDGERIRQGQKEVEMNELKDTMICKNSNNMAL